MQAFIVIGVSKSGAWASRFLLICPPPDLSFTVHGKCECETAHREQHCTTTLHNNNNNNQQQQQQQQQQHRFPEITSVIVLFLWEQRSNNATLLYMYKYKHTVLTWIRNHEILLVCNLSQFPAYGVLALGTAAICWYGSPHGILALCKMLLF